MKKFILAFYVLFIALKLSAQITFLGFDQPICSAPMTNIYTYVHYSYGSIIIDSLDIFIKNNIGDTIDYDINLFYVPLGMNELERPLSFYTVYPNPSQNTLYIKGDEFSNAVIYNTKGAKMYEGNSKIVNIEKFSKGIFIRIIDLNGGHTILNLLKN